jgi:hypothetical protein
VNVFVHKNTLAVPMSAPSWLQEFPDFVRKTEFHMTVLDRSDVTTLKARGMLTNKQIEAWLLWFETFPGLSAIPGQPVYLGLGYATDGVGAAYFQVYSWPEAHVWRAGLGLDPKDLHVTLSVRGHDPHNVPKDLSTIGRSHVVP